MTLKLIRPSVCHKIIPDPCDKPFQLAPCRDLWRTSRSNFISTWGTTNFQNFLVALSVTQEYSSVASFDLIGGFGTVHELWSLSVAKKVNYNFWTVRDRDIIFGMHTHLIKPFQMTPRSDLKLLTLTVTFILTIALSLARKIFYLGHDFCNFATQVIETSHFTCILSK